MREIKFRAYDVVKKEMLYEGAFEFQQFPSHFLIKQELRQYVFPFDGIESGVMCTGECLAGWHLMERTGYMDKNYKEIYEDDIIETPFGIRNKVIWHENRWCYANQFDEEGQPKAWVKFGDNDDSFLKVVGNIHENPELLTRHESEPVNLTISNGNKK